MLKIYRAIKTNYKTQGFYDNKVPYYKLAEMKYHGGYDWATMPDEPVYFDVSHKGFVLNTEIDNAGGLGINIITETEEGTFKHRYWHLKNFAVRAGDVVETGDLLGISDNTGKSSGNHLHRDWKEMIKDKLGNYKIKDRNNGSYGTVPIPDDVFQNIYVVDLMKNLSGQVSLLRKIINLIKQYINA